MQNCPCNMCRRTLEIGCSGFGNKKLPQVIAKVLISRGGRHFNDPLYTFSISYFNRWISLFKRGLPKWQPPLHILNSIVQLMILFFMRRWPKWTPPTLASVSMIEAKTIKELFGNYQLPVKINILYEL